MRLIAIAMLTVGLVGCAGTQIPPVPQPGSLAQGREDCERETQRELYSPTLTPPTSSAYPWTAGRTWAQNDADRLRERDIFDACMAQRGHPIGER